MVSILATKIKDKFSLRILYVGAKPLVPIKSIKTDENHLELIEIEKPNKQSHYNQGSKGIRQWPINISHYD